MSRALAKAAALKPDVRLAQAISEFEKDLSSEQKAVYRTYRDKSSANPPVLCDVMRLTAEIDRQASKRSSRMRCFGPRLTSVLQAIQQFAALGDVIVGGSQNLLACGIWSLVRMTLLAVVNYSSYLDKLSALLMRAGRSAPRYERLRLLYPRSRALRSHLCEYFIVIVRLCHHMLKLTQKSAIGQLVAFPSESDLKPFESGLEDWAFSIKEEVTVLMAEDTREQSSRLRGLLRSSEADAQRERLESYIRVLKACSSYDYETVWKETKKLGTANWFRQASEYVKWKQGPDSYTLMCTGKLGSGKSVLLANIVDDLNLSAQAEKVPVAYFFCRHDISESLQAGTVIRSLVQQLLRTFPDLSSAEDLIDQTTPVLAFEVLFKILCRIVPRHFKAYFVLDGLDECNPPQRTEIARQLRQLQRTFAMRLCVASRSDVDNDRQQKPETFAVTSIMVLPEENPDIMDFIKSELCDRIESGKLVLGDPTLSLEIEAALLKGAQGMFLWVALQIDSVCAAKTDEAIRQTLNDLPKDLPGTFSRILDKSGVDGSGKYYQKLTFELIIAAHRPLTTSELREALSVTPGDDIWDPKRLLNNVFSALVCCGSLITVDEENSTVRLIHHSVKQYLLGSREMQICDSAPVKNPYKSMRQILLTYLNYGVFDTQLSTRVKPSILAQAAPYKVIRSLETSSTTRSIALKLLKSRDQHTLDIGKAVADAAKQPPAPGENAFQFFAYATAYWLDHAWFISEEEVVAYKMLLKVITRKLGLLGITHEKSQNILFWAAKRGHPAVLTLCFNEGADVDSTEKQNGLTLLFWAAANGCATVIKMLVERGADLEFKDTNGRTPLSCAAGMGHDAAVRELILCGADMETTDVTGMTPLSWASNSGRETVAKTLIAEGANVESEATDGQSTTPLLWAAVANRGNVVKILLEGGADHRKKYCHYDPLWWAVQHHDAPTAKVLLDYGANIDSRDVGGDTVLHWATRCGDVPTVRLLLARGADPMSRDHSGGTPLGNALTPPLESADYWLTVKVLLESGADIEARNNTGMTPLMIAAMNGHESLIKALIDHGADRNARDNYGCTALDLPLLTPNNMRKLKMLLANGWDLEVKAGRGKTLLALAVEEAHLELVKTLLEYGANINCDGDNGLTMLKHPRVTKNEALRELLLKYIHSPPADSPLD